MEALGVQHPSGSASIAPNNAAEGQEWSREATDQSATAARPGGGDKPNWTQDHPVEKDGTAYDQDTLPRGGKDGYETGNPPRQSPVKKTVRDTWLWELLSLGVSIAGLIGIIAVLQTYDGATLPTWPLGITINALIAVLSAVVKAGLLVPMASCISQLKWLWFAHSGRPQPVDDFEVYDDASRGPIGAVALLWRVRASNLVAIGALVTALSVAVDPFVQQIVGFPMVPVDVGHATSMVAVRYNEGGDNIQVSGLKLGPSTETKADVLRGLFTPNVNPVEPFCPTGNCTFAAFDSLSFCSKCANVTDRTTSSARGSKGSIGIIGNWVQNITYALPGDARVNISVVYHNSSREDSMDYGPAYVATSDVPESMAAQVLGMDNPLLSFAFLQFNAVEEAGYDARYTDMPPVVHACVLYFCVNRYQIDVTNTDTKTRVLNSWYNSTSPFKDSGTTDVTINIPEEDQLPLPAPANASNSFSVYGPTVDTTQWYLNKTLWGTVLVRTSLVNSDDDTVDDVSEALKVSNDIPAIIDRLATSFSNRIRGMPNVETPVDVNPSFELSGKTGNMTGHAQQDVAHVHVSWGWLAFPASLVLLATSFLGATMWVSRREGFPVWKSSTLPVLYHGVGAGSGDAAVGLDEVKTMPEGARLPRLWELDHAGEKMGNVSLGLGTSGRWGLG